MPVRPQEIVERALAGPVGAGRAVVVTQTSEAVLRWANSTMTTDGHITAQDVAVVALEVVEGGTAVVYGSDPAHETNNPARGAARRSRDPELTPAVARRGSLHTCAGHTSGQTRSIRLD